MPEQLNAKEVYDLLKKKGVKHLHHANTVRTSLTFIKEKALVSRHYVEANGLVQTSQYTDSKDKRLGIWDSVFLDGYDLHKAYAINHYGPVLFLMKLDLLLDSQFQNVRVTRTNPSKWPFKPSFHESVNDVDEKYMIDGNFDRKVDADIMFLIDSPGTDISLEKHCNKIILDDPKIQTAEKEQVYDRVKKTLETALADAALSKIAIEKRHQDAIIYDCYRHYAKMANHNIEKFDHYFSKEAGT